MYLECFFWNLICACCLAILQLFDGLPDFFPGGLTTITWQVFLCGGDVWCICWSWSIDLLRSSSKCSAHLLSCLSYQDTSVLIFNQTLCSFKLSCKLLGYVIKLFPPPPLLPGPFYPQSSSYLF